MNNSPAITWFDWIIIVAAALGLFACVGRIVYLLAKPRPPEGCWYKPTGFLRDDNYRKPRE